MRIIKINFNILKMATKSKKSTTKTENKNSKKVETVEKKKVEKTKEEKESKEIDLSEIEEVIDAFPDFEVEIPEIEILKDSDNNESNVLEGLVHGVRRIIGESVFKAKRITTLQITELVNVSHKGAIVNFGRKGASCEITIAHDGSKMSFSVDASLIGDLD